MSTFYYLLEANAYLIVFYAFYKILLQKETFYSLNRFYLLASTGLSFLFPFMDVSAVRGTIPDQIYTSGVIIPAESTSIEWWQIAFKLYLLVVFGLLLRLTRQIYGISKLVKSGDVIAHGRFKEVQIKAKNLSFSFFNYLFINPELQEQNTIRKHELVHINQKHSLDILFIELVQITNWFNPIIYLIKTDIKAIHEFIADEIVSGDELGTQNYAMFLIQNSYGIQQNLSNHMFNQSLLKKRIMKLSQKKSRTAAALKYGLLALLIPIMLGVSAFSISKSYGIFDLMPVNAVYQDTSKKTVSIKSNSQAKVIPSKKNAAKPKVQNVKLRPPVVMVNSEKKVKNIAKVVIEEPVVSEVRIIESVNEIKMVEPVQEIKMVEPVQEIRIVEQKKLQRTKIGIPPPRPKAPKSVVNIRLNQKSTPPLPAKPKSAPAPMNIKRINEKVIPPPPPPVEPQSKSFTGDPVKASGKSETIKGDPISE